MNWITTLWPMVAGICIALGVVYLSSGLRGASKKTNLLFALIAFLMAAYSWNELSLIQASSPGQYLEHLRWQDFAGSAVAVALVVFVWVYFGTGRRWLAFLSIGLLCLTLVLDLFPTPKLVFLALSSIRTETTFAGVPFAIAEGVRNPWNALYYLAVALLMGFVVDASISSWRRGQRRRALLIGGSIVATFLVAGVHSYLVEAGILRMPYMVSFTWLFILAAMAWELSTDQLRAEKLAKELNDYRERLDLAANAANLGVWEWDVLQDRIHAYGPRSTAITPGESGSVEFDRYLALVHTDDRESLQRAVQETLDRGGELKSEFRVYAADGTTRWLSALGRAVRGPSGNSHHLRGISLDITERKEAELALQESESRLNEAQKIAHVGSWEWNVDSDRIVWSEQTYRAFGWDSALPAPDYKALRKLYTPESWTELDRLVRQALEKGDPFDAELEYTRLDGTHGWQISRGRVICDEQGRVSTLTGTVEDITARKRREKEIEDLSHELAHFNRIMQMNELSASLAHEINQPLGAILNNATAAQWLCSRSAPGEREITEILQCIVEDTNRASQVVRNIRSLARHDDVMFEPVSINAVIEEIMRFTQQSLQDNQVSLVLDLERDIAWIRGSRTSLQQVLLNLINNAQDAMRESLSKTLTVSSRTVSPDRIMVCVHDTGPGLDNEAKARAFNPFFTTKREGLGMGLRICQSILGQHGGEIWFEDSASGGARICFSLPVDRGDA
jgi:two-component system sensor kinase FixL